MHALIYFLLTVIAVGCSPKLSTHSQLPSATNEINEASAIAIARQAVGTNDTWVKRATFEAKRDGSGWSVFVQRHPIVPGGHRLVLIDETGRVVSYGRGK